MMLNDLGGIHVWCVGARVCIYGAIQVCVHIYIYICMWGCLEIYIYIYDTQGFYGV